VIGLTIIILVIEVASVGLAFTHKQGDGIGLHQAPPPVWESMSSTKPDVHNVSQCHRRTETRPQATSIENMAKLGCVVWFLRCACIQTDRDRRRDRQTYSSQYCAAVKLNSTVPTPTPTRTSSPTSARGSWRGSRRGLPRRTRPVQLTDLSVHFCPTRAFPREDVRWGCECVHVYVYCT